MFGLLESCYLALLEPLVSRCWDTSGLALLRGRYTRDEVICRTMFNFTAEQEMQETFQIVSDVLSGQVIVSAPCNCKL